VKLEGVDKAPQLGPAVFLCHKRYPLICRSAWPSSNAAAPFPVGVAHLHVSHSADADNIIAGKSLSYAWQLTIALTLSHAQLGWG
jgi:hypothetical protein